MAGRDIEMLVEGGSSRCEHGIDPELRMSVVLGEMSKG